MEDMGNQRTDFDAFPYPPYVVQQDFMANLYKALTRGGISLFESPTGTGKTLSLICGCLSWLEDNSAQGLHPAQSSALGSDDKENMPDWMLNFSMQSQNNADESLPVFQKPKPPRNVQKQAKTEETKADESDVLPEAYDPDHMEPDAKRQCLSSFQCSESESLEDDEVIYRERQVYFISRTHSQLSQFVGELRKTRYKDSFSVAALASRQALCVHPEVSKLKSAAAINERCIEMQKPAAKQSKGRGKKQACKCQFLSNLRASKSQVQAALQETQMDIEDLGKLGQKQGICPYYAARTALPASHIVLLPYSGLLSQEAREAFGVRLKNNILIIDEAHNLVNAVNDIHSALIQLPQLASAHTKLTTYLTKFQARLAPGNEQNIQLLIHVIERLMVFLKQSPPTNQSSSDGSTEQASQVCKVNDFLFITGLDGVDFFSLRRYIAQSKIMFKVAGYQEQSSVSIDPGGAKEGTAEGSSFQDANQTSVGAAPLQALTAFCVALSNHDADGRIVIDRTEQSLKFILLHAAQHFAKAMSQAHAVILASGTLAPMESLKAQLFPSQGVQSFQCGHVVAKERLLALALPRGPGGDSLDFRHQKRSQSSTIDQLGRLLINFCQAVPQGIVVFFPSNSYADETIAKWKASGLMAQLQAKKTVFTEPKTANLVEAVLTQYKTCILSSEQTGQGGALLLCVVGGKLAEGINFADGMGRCVVMAGMPYPNPTDPELKERMQHIQIQGQQGGAKDWGRIYYEDLCFKAVNQCIGRVIRHANDWAVIVLADARWAADNPAGNSARQQLPGWIQDSLVVTKSFGEAYNQIVRFCRRLTEEQRT